MTCTTGSGKSKKICLSAGQSEKLLSRNSVNIPNFIQCQHSQFHIDVWTFPGDYLILSSFWKSKEAGVWCHWGHTTETTKAIFPMKMKHGQKGTQWFYWTFFLSMPPIGESISTSYTSVLQQSSLEIPSQTCPELCLLGDSYSIHDENKTNICSA